VTRSSGFRNDHRRGEVGLPRPGRRSYAATSSAAVSRWRRYGPAGGVRTHRQWPRASFLLLAPLYCARRRYPPRPLLELCRHLTKSPNTRWPNSPDRGVKASVIWNMFFERRGASSPGAAEQRGNHHAFIDQTISDPTSRSGRCGLQRRGRLCDRTQ
jgi:hypothetical protein